MSSKFDFVDDEQLAQVERELRASNLRFPDRQLRVKLEAFDFSKVDFFYLRREKLKKEVKEEHEKKRVKVEKTPTQYEVRSDKIFKTMLNSSYSDYDFTSVKSTQFVHRGYEATMEEVKHQFSQLGDIRSGSSKCWTETLWKEIERILLADDEFLEVKEENGQVKGEKHIDVFSYVSDEEGEVDADPLSSLGCLWSFNFMFLNAKLGRIVFLAASLRQKKLSVTLNQVDSDLLRILEVQDWSSEDAGSEVEEDLFEFNMSEILV
eukprot:snap_masked-scaffold_14-processed-gene-11.38-mRNA-1 protein AED:1.00 eAED:1.00 QI:0/-1/0/0/-1/1/1/0/263